MGNVQQVVTLDAFDSVREMVLILHEFVHCHQNATCEDALKGQLEIAPIARKKATAPGTGLDFPSPYDSKTFTQGYQPCYSRIGYGG